MLAGVVFEIVQNPGLTTILSRPDPLKRTGGHSVATRQSRKMRASGMVRPSSNGVVWLSDVVAQLPQAHARAAVIRMLCMIIDAYGHYTTVPAGLRVFRALQISQMGKPVKGTVNISDDEIRASLEKQHQLRQQERTSW